MQNKQEKLFSLKGGNNILVPPLETKASHQENKEAIKICKEERLAAADAQSEETEASIAGALVSYAPYDRTSKRWVEITEAVTWWECGALS